MVRPTRPRPSGIVSSVLSCLFLLGVSLPTIGLAAPSPAPQIETWRSNSGVPIFFVPAPAIPLVDLAVSIDAGGRWEPSGLEGLADLTASLTGHGLRAEAGQPTVSEPDFERALGALAVQRSVSASEERVVLKARFLADPDVRQAAVGLLARQLAHPAFDEGVFQREQQRALSSLRDELTRPQTLAVRALFGAMFEGHPYGRPATEQSLSALTVDQVQAFHALLWRPERMQVVIVGALSRTEAAELAERLLKPLSESLVPQAFAKAGAGWTFVLPPVGAPVNQRLHLDHPASQSHLWLGMPLLARQDQQDYFPLLVANHILGGGGFSSRLTQEVREARGLSYSVFSALSPRAQKGPFMIGLQTQAAKSAEALEVVMQTLQTFVKEGPTANELEAAKKNLLGGFALRLDTNRKQLDALSELAFYGLPLDYLETWSSQVEAVSLADIRRVMQQRLRLDQLTTVTVGGTAPGAQ